MGIPEQSPQDVQKLINHVMKRGGGGHCEQAQGNEKWGGQWVPHHSLTRAGTPWGEQRSLGVLSVEEWREPGGEGAWHLKWERTRGRDSRRAEVRGLVAAACEGSAGSPGHCCEGSAGSPSHCCPFLAEAAAA